MFGKGFILREENDMIIKSVNLETVCGITSKLPDNTLPEVAFAGKSNVGKSSLINALMNRKSYARISAQPGKTQTIRQGKMGTHDRKLLTDIKTAKNGLFTDRYQT